MLKYEFKVYIQILIIALFQRYLYHTKVVFLYNYSSIILLCLTQAIKQAMALKRNTAQQEVSKMKRCRI